MFFTLYLWELSVFRAPLEGALFYNPKLYIEPPKKERTRAEAVYETVVPTTAAPAFAQNGAKPAPPPETFEGAYGKKSQESNGVIAMVDLLVADLDKEMSDDFYTSN